jgi:transcriptional regulator with GAF, ATPase, and Fis domain
LVVSRRQASAQGVKSDETRPGDSKGRAGRVVLVGARAREKRNYERAEVIDEAVAALERAAAVLRAEAIGGECDSLDLKGGIDLYQEVRRFEARLIRLALQEAGSQAGAARLLGVKASTLNEKIKRYGIN